MPDESSKRPPSATRPIWKSDGKESESRPEDAGAERKPERDDADQNPSYAYGSTVAAQPPAANIGLASTIAGQPASPQAAALGTARTVAGQPGSPPAADLGVARTVASQPEAPPTAPAGGAEARQTAAAAPAPAAAHSQAGPTPDPDKPFEAGVVVGDRFVIERHISSGGFGAVYKAADLYISNHYVALKVLHFPAQSAEERENALRELRLIASVPHPSVVQFKDYGWIAGRLWFAMPWYNGKTLEEHITDADRRRVAMSRKEARPIFERVAYGLAAMHSVGVNHRDIKPENIFVADLAGFEGGLPVLLDLGIATEKSEIPKGFTLEFVAPETASAYLGEPHKDILGAADVYALALTLRVALEPETVPDIQSMDTLPILMQRSSQPVPPPERKDLKYLRPYFEKWLNLDPAERPTSEEFAAQLAVLTLPEERRAARIRLMKRVAPFALIAAALIAFLWMQVTRQKVKINQQQTIIAQTKQELEQEIQKGDADRNRASAELAELSQNLSGKSEELKKTVAVAEDLKKQLDKTSDSRARLANTLNALRDQHQKLQESYADLGKKRDALQAERNRLENTKNKLASDVKRLTDQQARLNQDIGNLKKAGADLQARIDKLEKQGDALKAERDKADQALDKAKEALKKSDDALNKANKQNDKLEAENKKLKSRIDDLESELSAAKKKAATASGKKKKK